MHHASCFIYGHVAGTWQSSHGRKGCVPHVKLLAEVHLGRSFIPVHQRCTPKALTYVQHVSMYAYPSRPKPKHAAAVATSLCEQRQPDLPGLCPGHLCALVSTHMHLKAAAPQSSSQEVAARAYQHLVQSGISLETCMNIDASQAVLRVIFFYLHLLACIYSVKMSCALCRLGLGLKQSPKSQSSRDANKCMRGSGTKDHCMKRPYNSVGCNTARVHRISSQFYLVYISVILPSYHPKILLLHQ